MFVLIGYIVLQFIFIIKKLSIITVVIDFF